jgi:hypothetical protein
MHATTLRFALGGLAAIALSALAPSTALATISEGSATDPVGDSAGGGPSLDIVSAHARYDSNGQVTVSATMNGPIANAPHTFFSFGVASYSPPESCGGVTVSLFGFADFQEGLMTITGIKGLGSAFVSVFGNTIAFSNFGNTQFLANKSFSCMTLGVRTGGEYSIAADQLNPPLWFDGFGPPKPSSSASSGAPSSSSGAGAGPISAVQPFHQAAPNLISAFGTVAKVKRKTGVGALVVGCRAAASETCTFSLSLYATVKRGHASSASRVKVGTARGKVRGGRSGKLLVRLNAAGRRYLNHSTFHVEARGTVKASSGVVSSVKRRITLKRQ